MPREIAAQAEPAATRVAFERALLEMHGLDVLDHIAVQTERHMARGAHVLALAVMALHVAVEIGAAAEARAAGGALERALAVVAGADVLDKQVLVAVGGVALVAFEGACVLVDGADVLLHVGVGLEGGVAAGARKLLGLRLGVGRGQHGVPERLRGVLLVVRLHVVLLEAHDLPVHGHDGPLRRRRAVRTRERDGIDKVARVGRRADEGGECHLEGVLHAGNGIWFEC